MYRLSAVYAKDKMIITPRYRVRTWIRHKRVDFYVRRVETALYKRMGWAEQHYIDKANGNFSKSCHSLIFTDAKDRCVAYVALLNHTHRGCRNGMIISRFVISPQFQHRGYSMVLLNVVGGMLSSCGYRVYFNTRLKWLGEAMDKNESWVGSHFDKRVRPKVFDPKCKNRTEGYACRKRYVGRCLKGYSILFQKVNKLRERFANMDEIVIFSNTILPPFTLEIYTIAYIFLYNIIRCNEKKYDDSS